MFSALFGRRITVAVRIIGVVGDRVVRWEGRVRIAVGSDLRTALRAAGRAAGVDLLKAMAEGPEPTILLEGVRVELPEGLSRNVDADSSIAWLMPMAGG
ncbi:MAG: hypothetical protein ACOY93_05625 [Bacillota bacterium]